MLFVAAEVSLVGKAADMANRACISEHGVFSLVRFMDY